MSSTYRLEKDLLGTVKIPTNAFYGVFTSRAMKNFSITGLRIDKEFIITLAQIKKAAALTNTELGFLSMDLKDAIMKAADEVITGKYWEEFPLDVFQAGAGTPWNMNMNEVLANRSNQILGNSLGSYYPIHPNDHVNMSQSSNDVISNTIRITTLKLVKELYSELKKLEIGFKTKADEFKDIRKSARTHTQDAVPITIGQEMKAYSEAVVHGRERIEESTKNLSKLFLGGTAVGTGLNTHPDYSKSLLEHMNELTGLELSLAENFIEKTQFTSDFLHFMNSLTSLCVDLVKICNDLMIYSSGPRTGLREIVLPAVEPGSSIMPGKINPSILECVNMVLFQLIGRRTVIENVSQFGMMDLNVYTPIIAYNIFNSIKWLKKATHVLVKDCIEGLKVNREVTNYYFNHSNAIATILSPFIGYEKAALLAKEALIREVPVKTLVLEKGLLTKDEIEELIMCSFEPNLNVVNKIVEKRGENLFDK